ncbi:PSP1 C terminal conserved region [Trypanosoma vivax]|uniref:PSP1 C-terminal domain-containing protein n=1 Tax=Trypanosoma vivax (strain Y486) TaxID=1055687 RepID=G0U7S5_TRYVY|nr:hypothetical protein TRVL_00809 [Trypanosoma vivax]KAH8620425.1 PSP1 C terminal conserved region [Trypanosoma vivax]CCC51933.1 conserved hypothetical protein [Trypanosoma vivax Y486]
MNQQLMRDEVMRVALRQLQSDVNDFLVYHERNLHAVYDSIMGRLDRIQQAVDACVGIGNSHSYGVPLDQPMPSSFGCMADRPPVSTAAIACGRFGSTSTPHGERPKLVASDSRSYILDCMQSTEVSQWSGVGLSAGHDPTAANTPQKQWSDGDHAFSGVNTTVDYACFEPLDSVGADMDMQRSAEDCVFSPCVYGEEAKQERSFSEEFVGNVAKQEAIRINTMNVTNQHLMSNLKVVYSDGRPRVIPVPDCPPDDPEKLGIDVHSCCKVLVEFKRRRVLQFESRTYVPPGSYVMVGGDRGEDLGLVTYTWCEVPLTCCDTSDTSNTSNVNSKRGKNKGNNSASSNGKTTVLGVGLSGITPTRSIGLGSGTVLRLADASDVTKLHSMQVELERRAIDVCSQRVLERGLSMTIVDAEYQFDKNKLTFFYEAQQRMDFRELVRDLYKTFRARIWMEIVES